MERQEKSSSINYSISIELNSSFVDEDLLCYVEIEIIGGIGHH